MGHIDKTEDGKYFNLPEASAFGVKSSPLYIGTNFLFRGKAQNADYGNLTSYLKGGEFKKLAADFGQLYDSVPNIARFFADYMQSSCKFVGILLPQKIDSFWKSINSFVDIGGGSGYMTM